jgi:very-short-patch-repair endonuclease
LRAGNIQSCGCLKSVGEEKISQLLTNNNISFIREKIFNDFKPYRYDFYVNDSYIIEYDGKQHFQDYSWGNEKHTIEETQMRDITRNNDCFKNNIPIIRIPYTHLNNLTLEELQLETRSFLIKE